MAAPIWLAKAGSFLVKKGAQALKTGFSAKSGAATLSYAPPKMQAGKGGATRDLVSGQTDIMGMLKNPMVLGGIAVVLFLIFKK
jgi:hypothetical protein